MRTLSRPSTFTPASMSPWLLNLATRMLACSLQMPEPLVHSTGAFVFAHVQAAETRVGKTLCPIRLLRQLRNRLGHAAGRPSPVPPAKKGELP